MSVKLNWVRIDSELYRAESPLGQVEIIRVKDFGQPVWRALGPCGLHVDARLLGEAKRDAEQELEVLSKAQASGQAHSKQVDQWVEQWPRYELVFRTLPHPSKPRRERGESLWDYYDWKLRAYPQYRRSTIAEAFNHLQSARASMALSQREALDKLVDQAQQGSRQEEEPSVSDNIKSRPEVWLGKPPREDDARDAIHVAVLPVVVDGPDLAPGTRVGVVKGPDGQHHASRQHKAVGIIDPFLRAAPEQGSRVWVLLFPYTIDSLRHAWTHPGIDGERDTDG